MSKNLKIKLYVKIFKENMQTFVNNLNKSFYR